MPRTGASKARGKYRQPDARGDPQERSTGPFAQSTRTQNLSASQDGESNLIHLAHGSPPLRRSATARKLHNGEPLPELTREALNPTAGLGSKIRTRTSHGWNRTRLPSIFFSRPSLGQSNLRIAHNAAGRDIPHSSASASRAVRSQFTNRRSRTLFTSPSIKNIATISDPPELISGSGIPVTGIRPTTIPTFTKT